MTFALITGRINCASRMPLLAARYQNDNGESKLLPAQTAIFFILFFWEVWGGGLQNNKKAGLNGHNCREPNN